MQQTPLVTHIPHQPIVQKITLVRLISALARERESELERLLVDLQFSSVAFSFMYLWGVRNTTSWLMKSALVASVIRIPHGIKGKRTSTGQNWMERIWFMRHRVGLLQNYLLQATIHTDNDRFLRSGLLSWFSKTMDAGSYHDVMFNGVYFLQHIVLGVSDYIFFVVNHLVFSYMIIK